MPNRSARYLESEPSIYIEHIEWVAFLWVFVSQIVFAILNVEWNFNQLNEVFFFMYLFMHDLNKLYQKMYFVKLFLI